MPTLRIATVLKSGDSGHRTPKIEGDCLPRQSEQRNWLSNSSCLREEVEGISEELIAGEED